MSDLGDGRRPAARKPRAERSAEIVAEATRIFRDHGYDASNLQQIADSLGLLKGSLYYHFRSKEDLLYEVLHGVHERALVSLSSVMRADGSVLERLHLAILAHVRFIVEDLAGITVFFREIEALQEPRRRTLLELEEGYKQLFQSLIAEGVDSGVLYDDVDPALATLSALGQLNWIHRWFREDGSKSSAQISEAFSHLFLRGVARPEALAAFEAQSA